ncbi:alkaline phosphatase D family protein [Corynebacterium guangdongense]|uniref:Alkaline phosphatase D n=1 Tax=Corynebacterium guangdongense TaxID=1783348 RepID=A0ABU1ZYI2_9CORY|nr:alkaline phosphatase D family protein [Corynebacterium guangdongense]MDR7329905.1 alkaline phosphatase D [Corynebacterium guangdongense]WJZ18463.1 Phospholipase D precursor [Corynebacterium guangdongense]
MNSPERGRQGLSRRRVLQSTAGAVALSIAGAPAAQSQLSSNEGSSLSDVRDLEAAKARQPEAYPVQPLPFRHGVASGDPLPDTVILWTRVTPGEDAVPGSGRGEDVRLRWEIATDEAFTRIIGSGETVVTAATDHTVHVDPWGLEPDTEYFYRFTVFTGRYTGTVSPVGRTHTAPAFAATVESMNIAVASCANWESGYFAAYRDMAARGRAAELDLVVFLGDYIYEYGPGEYSGFGPFRLVKPAHEVVTLADYRMRYGQYRTDVDLQSAHAALPWVVVWDDHETADNSWSGGAANHQPATEGDWLARRNAAMQAYFEWLPIRETSPSQQGHIYRSFSYGDLVELTIMDLRTYRDSEAASFDLAGYDDPGRTMLGSEQAQWLAGRIRTSATTWNVLGTSVMFSPMNLLTLQQDERTRPVADFLAEHGIGSAQGFPGVPLNSDQWDGYGAARAALLKLLAEKGSNVLMLTGDIHTEWAHEISHGGRILGAELVGSSVSAPNIDEIIGAPKENAVSHLAESYLLAANPHLKHVELDHHGYAVARLSPDRVRFEFYRTPDVTNQAAEVALAHSMLWVQGAGFTEGMAQALPVGSSAAG